MYIGSASDKEFQPDKWSDAGYLHAFGSQDGNIEPNAPTVNAPGSGKVSTSYVFWFSAFGS